MHAKQAGSLPLLLWLTACATPCPCPQTPEQIQMLERAQQMEVEMPKPAAEEEQAHALTLTAVLASLKDIAALKDRERKQLLNQLQADTTKLEASDRFDLALLLSNRDMDDKSLKRAQQLLDELAAETEEPGIEAILLLQRQKLSLEQRYRTERRRRIELKKKIENLKGLERLLEESNRRIEEPLTTTPEPAK
jgi:Na+-translocating ferredoxin:NAD+ oxidoreductase RnfC subunit